MKLLLPFAPLPRRQQTNQREPESASRYEQRLPARLAVSRQRRLFHIASKYCSHLYNSDLLSACLCYRNVNSLFVYRIYTHKPGLYEENASYKQDRSLLNVDEFVIYSSSSASLEIESGRRESCPCADLYLLPRMHIRHVWRETIRPHGDNLRNAEVDGA